MTEYYLLMFVISLGLTLIIEIFAAFLLKVRTGRGLFLVFLVNVLTNPAAVLLCRLTAVYLPERLYFPVQILLEILVVLTEGLIYRKKGGEEDFRKPFLLSLLLNGLSYGTGLWIDQIF